MRRRVFWILLVAATLCARGASAAVPASERSALIAIFNATGGAAWTDRTGWLGTAGTECTWFAVRCSGDESSVIGIYLSQNNLTGSLPPDIGSFPNLLEIELYSNKLTGSIPTQVGNLTKLERLALYDNQLSGSIPGEIGNLTHLNYLALGNNQLSGAIPPALGNLTSLQFLSVNGGLLDGPIPPELGQLVNVQTIDFAYNRIAGSIPKELGKLPALTNLSLNNNRLTGSIPPEIGSLPKLDSLYLGTNQLSGSIPPQLGQLPVFTLSLGINQLSGPIPPELGDMKNVEMLGLAQNQLSGAIPPELSHLSSLRELELGTNQLTGTIPPQLGQLSNLERLHLEANQLTGSIPPELGSLSNLLVLSIGGNQLTGTLPPQLTSMTKLISLGFDSNQIGGPLPSDLGRLTDLVELVAYGNQLTGTIPSGIGSLTKLEQLLLGGNQLTGTIPPSITSLTKLGFLDLRGNQLTGGLPADIDRMASLYNISVFGNQLSGPIPDGVTRLPAVVTLRLEDNEFTGPIPAGIVNMTTLQFLGLRNNHLDGTIPAGIGNLTGLFTLWLGGNRLTGTIPAEIAALTNVTWLDLANNQFAGSLPHELMNLTNLSDNLSDFRYNRLSTTDAALRAFLNQKQDGGDWESTQTLPPSNVAVNSTTDRSTIVTWNLARYTDDDGGYRVTLTAAGAPTVVATTAAKVLDSILIRGLNASTSYSVTVQSVTFPHGLQQNTLISDPTSAILFTTTAAVIAPPSVELTASTSGLVQQGGQPENDDSFTLSNAGDIATTITLTIIGDFFAVNPATFPLAGGASQTVTITSITRPPGAYSGEIFPGGAGVPSGLAIPVQLLSVAAPSGTVIAQPGTTRVDLAGNLTGSVRFTNGGTATLSGICVADASWIMPPQDLITIAPGNSADITFTIDPAKRPATDGALAGALRLLYLNGTGSASIASLRSVDPLSDGSVSVSTVTVVFTPKPSIGTSSIPPLAAGEVARFIPGVLNSVSGAGKLVSDLFISNSFGIAGVRDLRLYLAGASAASAPVATFGSIAPSQSLQLASVVNSVYGSSQPSGSLLLRTVDWDKLLVNATLVDLLPAGAPSAALPVFRSDRAAAAGGQIALAGLEKSDQRRTDFFLQETAGNPASASIEVLDAAGNRVGSLRSVDLMPYGFVEIDDAVAPSGASAVVTNAAGSAGAIAAYAMVSDLQSGDRWALVDWSQQNRFDAGGAVKIALAEGSSGSSGRRRAASRATGAGVTEKTDVTLFNLDPTPAAATASLYFSGGNSIDRALTIAPRETRRLRDIVPSLFGAGGTGYLVVTPTRGRFAVTSRTYFEGPSGTYGSAVPVRAQSSGLRLGQKQSFAGVEDTASLRTGFGAVESEGKSARVRATLYYQDGRSVYATLYAHDYDLPAHGFLLIDDVASSILGPQRAALGDLHNLQITFEVVSGDGAATLFIVATDSGTGDATVRME